jgi:PAS domain S-box-containing protein
MTAPASQAHRFVSLKWKTLALTSAVLMLVHVALVLQGYSDALTRFEARQSLAYEQRIAVLKKLLDQSSGRLSRIASIVPGVINVAMIPEGFSERWAAMQIELQLEVMQLYDAAGKAQLRGIPLWDRPPEALMERIRLALRDERPSAFVLCEPTCIQYQLSPTLGGNGEHQLMVLGTSLADVVLEFPGLAGADVGLLVQRPEMREGNGGAVYWEQYLLAAVSDAPSNEPKVRALAQSTALAKLEQGGGLSFGGRSYRFYARPLQAFGSLTPGYFLVFGDSTEALATIRDQFQSQLLAGVMAMLAALGLLLAVMNRPMNQLRKLAQTLPMLAHSQYAAARDVIGQGYAAKRTHTEIDVLEAVAVDLSHRLEELEQTVAARSQALAEKIEEVRRANELNEKIFATAPMIFLIQSKDGNVVQMNAFGSQLLGYSESEVRGLSFVSLLADVRQRQQAGDVLTDIIGGRRQMFEQTGPVRCVDGSHERVTWLHTRIAAESGNYILSVGLPDKSLETPAQAH